jgi:hypothetical protein
MYGKRDHGVKHDGTLAALKRRTGFVGHGFKRFHILIALFAHFAFAAGPQRSWQDTLPIGLKSWLHGARSQLVVCLHGAPVFGT